MALKNLAKIAIKKFEKNSIKGYGNSWRWLEGNLVADAYEGQPEIRKKLMERIVSASRTKKRRISTNSIGTTLYIVGAINEDRYVDPHSGYDFVMERLSKVDKPEIGGIIAMEKDRHISRMGIITLVKPEIKVTIRPFRRRSLRVDVNQRRAGLKISKIKRKKGYDLKYYTYEKK